jgi:hypothetical protein
MCASTPANPLCPVYLLLHAGASFARHSGGHLNPALSLAAANTYSTLARAALLLPPNVPCVSLHMPALRVTAGVT